MSTIAANSSSAEPASLPSSCPTPPALQPIILVVEDHDDTREMLRMLVEGWGFRAVEACNGLEAVAAALRERPKLILMDSRLPFIDGLEATRRIRGKHAPGSSKDSGAQWLGQSRLSRGGFGGWV